VLLILDEARQRALLRGGEAHERVLHTGCSPEHSECGDGRMDYASVSGCEGRLTSGISGERSESAACRG
jgi:hypothetical protein